MMRMEAFPSVFALRNAPCAIGTPLVTGQPVRAPLLGSATGKLTSAVRSWTA